MNQVASFNSLMFVLLFFLSFISATKKISEVNKITGNLPDSFTTSSAPLIQNASRSEMMHNKEAFERGGSVSSKNNEDMVNLLEYISKIDTGRISNNVHVNKEKSERLFENQIRPFDDEDHLLPLESNYLKHTSKHQQTLRSKGENILSMPNMLFSNGNDTYNSSENRELELKYEELGSNKFCPMADFAKLREILSEIQYNSFCFLIYSINSCLEDRNGALIHNIKVACKDATQIHSVANITNTSFKHRITELVIKNQKNFTLIRLNDFSDYSHLIIIEIRNTSLSHIEDAAFGTLYHLTKLDLRHNKLVTLSWRILHPLIYSRSSKELSIFLEGNPLSSTDCGTQWAIERLEEDSRDIWKWEAISESSLEFGASTESSLPEEPFAIDIPHIVSDDQQRFRHIQSNTNNLNLEENLQSSNGDALSYKSEDFSDCMNRSSSLDDKCYLCIFSLNITTSLAGEKLIHVTCAGRGIPKPELTWEFEDPSIFSVNSSVVDGNFVSRTVSFDTYEIDRIATSEQKENQTKSYFARCLVANDREFGYISFCNRETQPKMKFLLMKGSSNVYIKVEITSRYFLINSSLWHWKFSPCAKDSQYRSNLTFAIERRAPLIAVGKLLYTKTDGVMLPGYYSLTVPTPCGPVVDSEQYFEGPPYQNPAVECPLIHPFQTLWVNTFDLKQEKPFPRSAAPSSPFFTKDMNIIEISNYTAPPLENIDTSSDSIVAVVLTGVIVVVLLTLWFGGILIMKKWKGNRIVYTKGTRNYESPFKIIFLGCPCRDKEGDGKEAPEFPRHEMHVLSPERLVENPEYMSSSEPEDNGVKIKPNVIPSERIKFVSELGEGAFGRVYLGLMDDAGGRVVKVAVKTLKSLSSESQLDLKREVEMLSSLNHEKIVKFYGVCHDCEGLMMVFEYMEHGDLNNYLRLHNEEAGLCGSETPRKEPLSVMDCLQIALQIASGMTYLASQHYVHRDLATRNCLVTNTILVKIGDFGMSRDVYTSDYYQIGGRALMPVRWMPPESILYRRFTIESDIWSFGVVLWEIFTGGKQPWYGYTNQEVITQITAGRMLNCPEKCPQDMYSLMVSCWAKQPQERRPMVLLYKSIRSLTTPQPHVIDC